MNVQMNLSRNLKDKPADESKLGFGHIFTDHMLMINYTDGKGWHDARIVPYGNLSLDPACQVLHYGQEIFEGLKCYRTPQGGFNLFRPRANFERFARSAERMGMAPLPVEDGLETLLALLDVDKEWTPHQEGTSLYIRPTMIATDNHLGVSTSSTYLYYVILSPSGAYYASGLAPVGIYVEDSYVRLEANPFWWKQQPDVHSINFLHYWDISNLLTALQSGEVEMMQTRSTSAALTKKLSYCTSMDYSTSTYEVLVPNLSGILSDLNLRKAILYAIDYNTLISNVYLDMAQQCEVPVPPGSWLYESRSAMYYYSPERALQYLNEAGWVDLTGDTMLNQVENGVLKYIDVKILVYDEASSNVRRNAANLIAENLRAVGINAEIQLVEWESWVEDVYTGRQFQSTVVGVDASNMTARALLRGAQGHAGGRIHPGAGGAEPVRIPQPGTTAGGGRRRELFRLSYRYHGYPSDGDPHRRHRAGDEIRLQRSADADRPGAAGDGPLLPHRHGAFHPPCGRTFRRPGNRRLQRHGIFGTIAPLGGFYDRRYPGNVRPYRGNHIGMV